MGSSNRSEEQKRQMAELSKSLKEGERIVEPTRRPDGTLRKPIRIRAGYVPQDEVVKYQSKGSLIKKQMESLGPPGYEPEPEPAPKPKSKGAKRNERRKEKRLQATAEKGNSSEDGSASNADKEEAVSTVTPSNGSQSVNVLVSGLEALDVSSNNAVDDTERRIRALKKKIRLTEAQQQKTAPRDLKPEQLEKFSKLEDWRQELKTLEDKLSAAST